MCDNVCDMNFVAGQRSAFPNCKQRTPVFYLHLYYISNSQVLSEATIYVIGSYNARIETLHFNNV